MIRNNQERENSVHFPGTNFTHVRYLNRERGVESPLIFFQDKKSEPQRGHSYVDDYGAANGADLMDGTPHCAPEKGKTQATNDSCRSSSLFSL